MQFKYFNATSPYEIGDIVCISGMERAILDIACIHFVSTGKVEFSYKLDDGLWYILELCKGEHDYKIGLPL